MFLNQSTGFLDEDLRTYAAAIGLDEGDFNNCLGSNRYRNEINEGVVAAGDRGVNSTPTIFVNGQKLDGIPTFEQLQAIIDAELG